MSVPLTAVHSFRIYCSGSDGPVLFLLHGGGHSALSWAVFTVSTRTVADDPHTLNSPLYINESCYFSVAEYFNLTRLLKCLLCGFGLQAVICSRINCRVVAMDLRAHGEHFPQFFLNHIQWFYCHKKSAQKAFRLWFYLTALPFLPPNGKVYFFHLSQVTPEWKTKTISQQTQWQSELLCALSLLCVLHWPILVVSNKGTRIVAALRFVLPKGYWQSGGSSLWRHPTSHHDDRPQHGRLHCSSHGRCQSCTFSAWPVCDWCRRRYVRPFRPNKHTASTSNIMPDVVS